MFGRHALKKWAKKDDGVTAIEFSLLAAPFMFIVVGIIEMALMFTASSLLEGAVHDGARMVRTGQLQQMGGGGDAQREAFMLEVCSHAGFLINCDNIQYQVIRLDSFNDDTTPEVDDDGNLRNPDQFDVDEVTSGCISAVRLAYLYPLFTPFFAQVFSNYPDGKRLLMATSTFETEPYSFDVAEGCNG